MKSKTKKTSQVFSKSLMDTCLELYKKLVNKPWFVDIGVAHGYLWVYVNRQEGIRVPTTLNGYLIKTKYIDVKRDDNNFLKTNIKTKDALNLINTLKKISGAIPYDGVASSQVVFKLGNGKTLRLGVTDEDTGTGLLWIDQYEGLNGEFARKAVQKTKNILTNR